MRRTAWRLTLVALIAYSAAATSQKPAPTDLWLHRNLGKAYYETPGSEAKAISEFRQALTVAPHSARDRVNYGLALLRAGDTGEAIRQLAQAQKQNPLIAHTWFSLGMAFKKQGSYPQAIAQFQGMLRLVPEEPTTHYNLGVVYKLLGRTQLAIRHLTNAGAFNPNFAAPHYQLFSLYQRIGRPVKAANELERFKDIRKRQGGAPINEDPEWNRYAEIYDEVELEQEDKGLDRGTLTFNSQVIAKEVPAGRVRLVPLDLNGDGHTDLLVYSSDGIQVYKGGTNRIMETGLEGEREIRSVVPGDYNNDGLPDLLILAGQEVKLFTNREGRFDTAPMKLATGDFNQALWLDYDHDYDLDIVLLGAHSMLLSNNGPYGFSEQTSHFPFVNGIAIDGAVFDLDPDQNESDVAVQYEDGRTVIYRDRSMGIYEANSLPALTPRATSITAFDLNNDGWTDLLLTTPKETKLLLNNRGQFQNVDSPGRSGQTVLADLANRGLADLVIGGAVYRNMGGGRFLPGQTESLPDSVALTAADFDGDGRVDIAAVTWDRTLLLLTNTTVNSNHSISVRLRGVKNIKSAQGAIVEVKSGAWYQKQRYAHGALHFGLREYPTADTVRITWPNGLVQNETKQSVDRQLSYLEKPRLSGSCPTIFAWDGKRFAFITDVLGVAPLGASSGDGQYFSVNHREYVKIPTGLLQLRKNAYELRITEELHEVSYLDELMLLAVDHPAEVEVLTNDKFTSPPFPAFRIYGIRHPTRPVSATDQKGGDVLARVVKEDGKYVDSFKRTPLGLAELHYLELDFGDARSSINPILVLNGWVDWADGSTFRAISQASKEGAVFPYLQIQSPSGTWQTVIADMGMPSGKPKSIVVDLAGKFLSPSRRVRIVTNLCVYWDDIFLAENDVRTKLRLTPLTTISAALGYGGFSEYNADPGQFKPAAFTYERWTPTTMWNPTPGLYTRYGKVRSLLSKTDEKMVIMGSGDELKVRFSPLGLPGLPLGWKRDFLLLVDGWAKDADPNTAFGQTVEPLPFHGMDRYPYPASQNFPHDPDHEHYLKTFNTRRPLMDLPRLRPR